MSNAYCCNLVFMPNEQSSATVGGTIRQRACCIVVLTLAPGDGLSHLVYCCDNRWRPNHMVTHGHKTEHVFDMDENNSVGITTSENSWNRACHVSSYY